MKRDENLSVAASVRAAALARLRRRAVVYVLYSAVVWVAVALLGGEFYAEKNAFADWSAIRTAFTTVALAAVLGGLTTFVVAARCRRRAEVGLEEALLGIAGRTGVPALAILAVAALCDEATARPVLLGALGGYFLTAPVALWGTFPPEPEAEGSVEQTAR